MNRRKLIVLSASLALVACGGSGESGSDEPLPDQTLTQVTVTVTLPAGVVAGEVLNTMGAAAVADGKATLTQFASGRQLAVAVSETGAPLLMGWVGPQHATLDARTTAEVLTWVAVGGFTAPPALAPRLREALAEADEVDDVATALTAALEAQPQGITTPDAALQAALLEAATTLATPEGAPVAGIPTALLVNPAGEKSGVRLDQSTGFNEITLVNSFRRPAFAFVDRVSIVTEAGEQPSPEKTARVEVPAVQGLQGGVGTVSQILVATQENGGFYASENVAYVPRSTAPIAVPNVPKARRTRYRVAVVGPGIATGDAGSLTAEELNQQLETTLLFGIKDVILPMLLNVVLPMSDISAYIEHPLGKGLIQDLGNLLTTTAPAVVTKLSNGDVRGGITDMVTAFGSSGTIRDTAFELIKDRFYDFQAPGGAAGFARASAVASGFANVSAALDGSLTVLDTLIIDGAISRASVGEIWTVDVADATVRLEPRESTIAPGELATLTVKVLEAGEGAVFEYRFHTKGTAGDLQGTTSGGLDVTTSTPAITYDAKAPGEDVIVVDVHQIDLAERPYVGSAEATVTVEGAGVFATAAADELEPFATTALSVELFAAEVPNPMRVVWTLDGPGATLDGGAKVDVMVQDASRHTVTFAAGFKPGDYVATAKAYRPAGDSGEPETLLGEDTVTVTVKDFVSRITPLTSDIGPGETQLLTATVTPTPPEGSFTYDWEVTTAEGLVDGARTASHTSESATDSVTYQAVAEPATCAQEVALQVKYTLGQESVSPPRTQATVRVDCPVQAKLTIAPKILAPGQKATAKVTLEDPPAAAGELRYRWSLSVFAKGRLDLPGGASVGADPVASNTVVYTAPDEPAEEFISVEILQGAGAAEEVIATAKGGVSTTVEDVFAAGTALFANIAGCGTAAAPDLVAIYWFYQCPDFGTPFVRVEVATPAYILPAYTSEKGAMYQAVETPSGHQELTAPPFLEESESITGPNGFPPDGFRWVGPLRHLPGCNPPTWKTTLEEILGEVATITCIGTFDEPE
ncbi:MAG: hypothetical protein H6744_09340 [Deltaproteobacteria bacterium]|nr:hypothetical protein [Deltaproteobacteria bacterium]